MLTWILKAASLLWPVVWQFVEPLLRDAVRQQLAILLPLAEDAVKTVQKDPSLLTRGGTAKREAAFNLIANQLASKEEDWFKTYSSRVINQAIELAVEKVFPTGVKP